MLSREWGKLFGLVKVCNNASIMFQSALISTCTLSDSLINTNLSNRDFMFIK